MKFTKPLLTSAVAVLAVAAASSAVHARTIHIDPAAFSFYVTDPDFATSGYLGGPAQVYPENVPGSYGYTFPNGVNWVDFGLDGETLTFGEGDPSGYQLVSPIPLWTVTLLGVAGGRDKYEVTFSQFEAATTVDFTNPATGMTEPVTLTPVPEPAAWSLMLIGLGGLGAIVRRKRAIPSEA